MNELKTCPFCGGEAEFYVGGNGYIQCTHCLAMIPYKYGLLYADGKRKAIATWNRRTQPENKPLSNFDRITQSPEELAKFLQGVWNGVIEFDMLYCDECGNCLEGSGCKENSDEVDCIMRWLDKPEQEEK